MVTIKCKVHQSYQGECEPQDECLACWFLWKLVREGFINVYGYPLLAVAAEKGGKRKRGKKVTVET